MNTYPEGSSVRFEVVFKDAITGAYVDPTNVTFKIRRPDTGIVTTWTTVPVVGSIVKDSTGHYHANYTCDFPGQWRYRFEGAGVYIGTSEKYVSIMGTAF